jgi:hypothetical protein
MVGGIYLIEQREKKWGYRKITRWDYKIVRSVGYLSDATLATLTSSLLYTCHGDPYTVRAWQICCSIENVHGLTLDRIEKCFHNVVANSAVIRAFISRCQRLYSHRLQTSKVRVVRGRSLSALSACNVLPMLTAAADGLAMSPAADKHTQLTGQSATNVQHVMHNECQRLIHIPACSSFRGPCWSSGSPLRTTASGPRPLEQRRVPIGWREIHPVIQRRPTEW